MEESTDDKFQGHWGSDLRATYFGEFFLGTLSHLEKRPYLDTGQVPIPQTPGYPGLHVGFAGYAPLCTNGSWHFWRVRDTFPKSKQRQTGTLKGTPTGFPKSSLPNLWSHECWVNIQESGDAGIQERRPLSGKGGPHQLHEVHSVRGE